MPSWFAQHVRSKLKFKANMKITSQSATMAGKVCLLPLCPLSTGGSQAQQGKGVRGQDPATLETAHAGSDSGDRRLTESWDHLSAESFPQKGVLDQEQREAYALCPCDLS